MEMKKMLLRNFTGFSCWAIGKFSFYSKHSRKVAYFLHRTSNDRFRISRSTFSILLNHIIFHSKLIRNYTSLCLWSRTDPVRLKWIAGNRIKWILQSNSIVSCEKSYFNSINVSFIANVVLLVAFKNICNWAR